MASLLFKQSRRAGGTIQFRGRAGRWLVGGLFGVCLLLRPDSGAAQTWRAAAAPPAYRNDRIFIQPKPAASRAALVNLHASLQGAVLRTFDGLRGLQVVRLPKGVAVPDFVAQYQASGLVEFAEPDHFVHLVTTSPNDPYYQNGLLWALHNEAVPHADIDAPAAWEVLHSASNIVVATLDTGVWYTHEDLLPNIWTNPNDGGHGFNALTGSNDPKDDEGHGTVMAGILGARGNNGRGVVGVAWQVQIMACKCVDSSGYGSYSDLVAGLDYARTNGARVINVSLGDYFNSQAFSNALVSLREAGVIVVAACGNDTTDTDLNPFYPASYDLDNVVSVAATSIDDSLAWFSNYGAATVKLAAPGLNIYSTAYGADTNYTGPVAGTSASAPYVTGALALLLAKFPTENYQQIISRLLNATDRRPSLAGKCVTGGRLNLRNALSPPIHLTALPGATGTPFRLRLSGGPRRSCIIQLSADLKSWSSISTNVTADDGGYDFTDPASFSSAQRFYRATASP